jgi:uncharacterized protein YkwD
MLRRGHSSGGLLLAAALAAFGAASAPPAAHAQSIADRVEQEIRKCANRERAKRGLPHLTENPILDKAARFHAKNMATHDFFDHDDPQGRGPAERIDIFGSWQAFNGIGENIAAGEDGPAETCRDWMESPGHRENILDPSFHAIGGGFARGNTEYRFYYVQEFGERNVGAPAPKPKQQDRSTWPNVTVRLFNAQDRVSLSVDGQHLASVHPGQRRTVDLGRLGPDARIEVEAFSAGSYLSWGIEERTGSRAVYRDTRAIGAQSTDPTTVDLATGKPLVHHVTLDARGRVLSSSSVHAPRLPLPSHGPISRWR